MLFRETQVGTCAWYWPPRATFHEEIVSVWPPEERLGVEVRIGMANGCGRYRVMDIHDGVVECELIAIEEWTVGA